MMRIFCAASFAASILNIAVPGFSGENFSIVRLNNNQPIITEAMFDAVGAAGKESNNIQGPSVIRIPDWIAPGQRISPDAVYYMYFANHHGDYIRMAWASHIEGPWHLHKIGAAVKVGERGVLDLGEEDKLEIGNNITIRNHIASPDVHLDDENKLIVMYFHGPTSFDGENAGQKSFITTSRLGLDFSGDIRPAMLGNSYFRVFQYGDKLYSISNGGKIHRALDLSDPGTPPDGFDMSGDLWDNVGNPFEGDLRKVGHQGRLRHSAVRLVGNTLQVFYSRIGDSPERIMLSTIDLSAGDVDLWKPTFPPEEILHAELGWEGSDLQIKPSKSGYAPQMVNQLRDPCLFEDNDGSLYLFYSGGGENAIGVARLIDQRSQKLFTFEGSDDGAEIHLYANNKAKKPVSRYLYGKFSEHLGRNIYGGMWAQILNNPGFEGWHFWGKNREEIQRRALHQAERLGVPDIMESYDKGIAPWWLAYGRGDVSYEPDTDSFNSELAQKITVNSLESQQAGVRQVIFLPLHREKDYELSLYAHSDQPCKLNIAIRKARDGESLAEGEIKVAATDWKKYNLKLAIHEDMEKATPLMITIGLSEPGTVWLDQMALFPADNVDGFDPDVIRFTRESRLPILRYPGGNFVSGYHWKDGVGPVDKRKSTANRPWNSIEYNHVGTDEFMGFCKAAGTEPMICLNAGDGSPEEAAEWLEYCNGSVDTKYGAMRAENGHLEPYNVVYWEVGNEIYGRWQIGHCSPEEYAERYEKFYRAMMAVDPTIKIIANGQHRKWNAPIIEHKSDILRSLSIHTLIGGGTPETEDPEDVFQSLMAYTTFYEEHLRSLGEQMAQGVKNPMFAVTELQVFTNRGGLPNNSSLTESLFWSGIVNTCIRLGSLVEMITHSALVNHGGGLRKQQEIVYANPVYYARKLYSTQSGTTPVRINVRCPMYKSSGRYSPADKDVPYLDAVALMDDNDGELNLIITNRHPREAIDTNISLHDFAPARDVSVHTHTGQSYMSRNELGHPDEIGLEESSLRMDGTKLSCSVPAHSIILFTFSKKKG